MHEHLKRRTFAIISHPDAGKTTLTEKLLLFGGAIQVLGDALPKRACIGGRRRGLGAGGRRKNGGSENEMFEHRSKVLERRER